ncbi:MAG: energy transducer TonB [Bacteroidota bacterium]
MELKQATNLLSFIEEQERRERRKKLRYLLGIAGAVVVLGVAGFAWYWSKVGGSGLRTFPANQLTRSQVISLFEQENSPILVSYEDTRRPDTIRSPEEYTLYLAARTVSIQPTAVGEDSFDGMPRVVNPEEVSGPLATADIMPAFPGGEAALYRFLSNQIRYPEKALRNKAEGKVYIRFIVQPDGSITDLDILRGIGFGCDEEALRVVQMMPRWVPGELGGQKVAVYSSLAIEFKFL